MKSLFSFIIILFLTQYIFAQDSNSTDCACCNDKSNQFDFWLGDWVVYDTLDNVIGSNKIIKLYENCLIQENWISQGKNRGTSYNYFDPSDTSWNQLWIDNQGTILKLKGGLVEQSMVLKSELQKGKKVDWYYNRITWSRINKGYVKQIWDILDKNNNLLTTVFTGIYKPK